MARLIDQAVDHAHYRADACIVWCFDDRFSPLLETLIKREGFSRIDLIKVAGGAKDLASPAHTDDRRYLLAHIEKSITLHHPRKIILMVHAECGAYGRPFSNREEETQFYAGELGKAARALGQLVRQARGAIALLTYYADFGGLSAVP